MSFLTCRDELRKKKKKEYRPIFKKIIFQRNAFANVKSHISVYVCVCTMCYRALKTLNYI